MTHSRLAVSGNAASSKFEEKKPIMPSAPAGSERFARSVPGDAQIESLRLPPHSVEAEQAVLGGLLLSNAAWDRIGDVISESDFYRADHRVIWRVITHLVEENKPADVLTVARGADRVAQGVEQRRFMRRGDGHQVGDVLSDFGKGRAGGIGCFSGE